MIAFKQKSCMQPGVEDPNSQSHQQLKTQEDLLLAQSLPRLREFKDEDDPTWVLCWNCVCCECDETCSVY